MNVNALLLDGFNLAFHKTALAWEIGFGIDVCHHQNLHFIFFLTPALDLL